MSLYDEDVDFPFYLVVEEVGGRCDQADPKCWFTPRFALYSSLTGLVGRYCHIHALKALDVLTSVVVGSASKEKINATT